MEDVCPECKGALRVKEKDGTIHPCYKCLSEGKMDQHAKNLKDASEFGLKF